MSGNELKRKKLSFAEKYPHLTKFWSEDNSLTPQQVSSGSGVKVKWICINGHSWEEIVNNFVLRSGKCYYCNNTKTLSGFNDLKTTHPELLLEWDYCMNELEPNEVRSNQDVLVWWKCFKENHSYQKMVSSKVKSKAACPYCLGSRVLFGFNDLYTVRKDLMVEWSEENDFDPKELLYSTTSICKWNCIICGIKYEKSPRGKRTTGCSKCLRRNISKYNRKTRAKKRKENKTTLADIFPELLKEWDWEKNLTSPEEYAPKSNDEVWWKCFNGHSYKTSIGNRTNIGTGCKKCSTLTSKGECELYEFIQDFSTTVDKNNRTVLEGIEIDIFIPDLKVGIEFNGDYWHSNKVIKKYKGVSAKEWHLNKIKISETKDVELLFVWEFDWTHNQKEVKNKLTEFLKNGTYSELFNKLEGPFDNPKNFTK